MPTAILNWKILSTDISHGFILPHGGFPTNVFLSSGKHQFTRLIRLIYVTNSKRKGWSFSLSNKVESHGVNRVQTGGPPGVKPAHNNPSTIPRWLHVEIKHNSVEKNKQFNRGNAQS